MSLLEEIPNKKDILVYDGFNYQGNKESIFLYRAPSISNPDYYYLRLKLLKEESSIKQGYVYFYLDFEQKSSQFIGLAIQEDFRGSHLSTLLLSSWIQFSLQQDFHHLSTIQKQRKPFLLYLLKKFYFDLENSDLYEQKASQVISIYRKQNEDTKYLQFHDPYQEQQFVTGKIMKSDNYKLITDFSDTTEFLDQVILDCPYFLKDENKAYQKSLDVYSKHRS